MIIPLIVIRITHRNLLVSVTEHIILGLILAITENIILGRILVLVTENVGRGRSLLILLQIWLLILPRLRNSDIASVRV